MQKIEGDTIQRANLDEGFCRHLLSHKNTRKIALYLM